MIRSIGLDLVDITRMERNLKRYGQRFIDRLLSPEEQRLAANRRDKAVFVAGRFAAKEAVIKGLGAFLTERPPYTAISIESGTQGAPVVKLPESTNHVLKGIRCHLSITHERKTAAAVAVFEELV